MDFGGAFQNQPDASGPVAQVLLGPIQRVKCGASANQIAHEGELCDALPAPDRDIIIVPRLACSTLDPSAPAARTTAGWGIDATKPMKDNGRFAKVRVPGVEAVDYV